MPVNNCSTNVVIIYETTLMEKRYWNNYCFVCNCLQPDFKMNYDNDGQMISVIDSLKLRPQIVFLMTCFKNYSCCTA